MGPCAKKIKSTKKSLKQQQLTTAEQTVIDAILRKHGRASDALRFINLQRAKGGVRPIGKNAVHRFVKGVTHKRGVSEARGRKRVLSKLDVRKLDKARRRLIKIADNEWRVTYKEIVKEAGLTNVACQRVCEEALRERGINFRPPRRKIQLSDEDAKKRLATAKNG